MTHIDYLNLAECIRKCRGRSLKYNPNEATYFCPIHGAVCTDELLFSMRTMLEEKRRKKQYDE